MEVLVLGLDISTACTGWTLLDNNGTVIEMGHIDFKGCDTLWEKVDRAHAKLETIVSVASPTHCFIEESLQAFRPGLSSASTLLTLAKFNGLISFYVRSLLNADPVYISSGEARKLVGVKLLQKKKHPRGYGYKQQTFEVISGGILKARAWPLRRNVDAALPLTEAVQSWAMDEVDSYVIARAGWITLNKTSA